MPIIKIAPSILSADLSKVNDEIKEVEKYADLIHVVIPILIVGAACWITFHMACQAEKTIRQPTLDVVERVGGFILAAMAVEMMAAGLRALFPLLTQG